MTITGVVQSLWRHPIKGFTPEPVLALASLHLFLLAYFSV